MPLKPSCSTWSNRRPRLRLDARNHPVDRTRRRDAAPARQCRAPAGPRGDRRPAGPARGPPRTASCARCARSGSSTRTATPAATRWPPACAGSASGWDRHDLRSRAMNWADSLAGSAGQEVLLGMPAGLGGRAGAPRLPARRLAAAAADGRAAPAARHGRRQVPARLRADRRAAAARARPAALHRAHRRRRRHARPSTSRRPGSAAGRPSWGSTGRGSAGSPRRCAPAGGLVVGALGVEGPVEELFGGGGTPVPRLVEQLLNAAREISAGLGATR